MALSPTRTGGGEVDGGFAYNPLSKKLLDDRADDEVGGVDDADIRAPGSTAGVADTASLPFEPAEDSAVAFDAPPGCVALALAVAIFSSSSSAYVLLKSRDEDVFTACNVLCTSNTYGVLFMVAYLAGYKRSLAWQDLAGLSRADLLALLAGSVLYQVVGPFFFYLSLDTLSVPAASILQRLESLYFLFLSYMFLQADISTWALASGSLTFLGVLLATFWNSLVGEKASYPRGIFFIILSGFAYSGSLLVTKKFLSKCNTGLVALARAVVGTVLFHLLSIAMGDSDRLYEAKAWALTLPYGFVYVFVGQVSWTTALQRAAPVHLSVGTSALFPLTLTWAAVLITSVPKTSQWVAAAFIVAGIASSVAEALYKDAAKTEKSAQSGNTHPPTARNTSTMRELLISLNLDAEEEAGSTGNTSWSRADVRREVIM